MDGEIELDGIDELHAVRNRRDEPIPEVDKYLWSFLTEVLEDEDCEGK
jgi:hypothetical protein